MKLNKTLLAAALTMAMGAPLTANAVNIDGIEFEPGSIFETLDLFEGERNGGPIVAAGQELVGIGIVNFIRRADLSVLWQNTDNGRELVVYFYNYIAEAFSTTGDLPGPGFLSIDQIAFSGGIVEIYSQAAGTFSATGTIQDGIDSVTGGDLFLSLVGSPVGGQENGNDITLRSTATNTVGNPFNAGSVTGNGLLDVTGGAAAAFFDTNTFGCEAADGAPCPDDADKNFASNGALQPGGTGAWIFTGTGTVRDFAVVPEPTSIALIGAGILGAGFAGKRRRNATV